MNQVMYKYYVLKGHIVVQTTNAITFGKFMESQSRRVAETKTNNAYISTVFLGIDHQFGDGPPLVFETMVFGGPLDDEQDRYSTWDEAVAGHAAMVKRVEEAKRK